MQLFILATRQTIHIDMLETHVIVNTKNINIHEDLCQHIYPPKPIPGCNHVSWIVKIDVCI